VDGPSGWPAAPPPPAASPVPGPGAGPWRLVLGIALAVGGFLGLMVGALAAMGEPGWVQQPDGAHRVDTSKPWWSIVLALGGLAAIAFGIVLIVVESSSAARERRGR